MSYTKRQFVEMAFDEIGLSSANLQPEQMQTALKRLDAMMALWNKRGVRISYPFSDSPDDSSLDTKTTVPDSANEAIYTNLAVRICPAFGKQLSPDLNMRAKDAYKNLITSNLKIGEMQTDILPRGSGSKSWKSTDNRFIRHTQDEDIDVGDDSSLEF